MVTWPPWPQPRLVTPPSQALPLPRNHDARLLASIRQHPSSLASTVQNYLSLSADKTSIRQSCVATVYGSALARSLIGPDQEG